MTREPHVFTMAHDPVRQPISRPANLGTAAWWRRVLPKKPDWWDRVFATPFEETRDG